MPNISEADKGEFYRGVVHGNKPDYSSLAGFLVGLLYRGF